MDKKLMLVRVITGIVVVVLIGLGVISILYPVAMKLIGLGLLCVLSIAAMMLSYSRGRGNK